MVPRIKVKQPFGDPEQLERIKISRQLVELRRDVPLPIALDDLVVGDWNLPELLQLFTELEFQLLVEKVKMRMPPADDVDRRAGARDRRRSRSVDAARPMREIVVARRRDRRARGGGARGGRMAITVELDPERARARAARRDRDRGRRARRRRTSRSATATSARRRRRPPSDLAPLYARARRSDGREGRATTPRR